MKILITGATGFLGSRLIERLAKGHEIWALSRRAPALSGSNVHALIQDLTAYKWADILPKSIDAVIHLAQSSAFRDFPASAEEVYAVSAGATVQLLDWAHRSRARHFILGSTGGLYGSSNSAMSESWPIPDQRNQLGFYFAGKRSSELIASQYDGLLNVAILRFFFVYGSGQANEMLIPRLATKIRLGQPVSLQGDDGIRINPVHVNDAVVAVERCLALDGSQVINIAGPQVVTLRAIAEMVGGYVGRQPVFAVDKIAVPNHYVADITRMSEMLGAPKIGVRAGLAELLGIGSGCTAVLHP
jgi:UDP-glucose 4-epimerase